MDQYNRQKIVAVEPTLDTDAYTANDVAGGLQTLDVASSGGGGTIRRIVIADEDAAATTLSLYLFNDTPTTIADDAAFAPTIADLRKLVAVETIATADWVTVNSLNYVILEDVNIDFTTDDGLLYLYIVDTAGTTWTNADSLYFRFACWLD